MAKIYIITEKNVDGCGTDATEFVKFDCEILPDAKKKLKECLDYVKKHADKTANTSDMVQNALAMFEAKTGIFGALTRTPIYDTIEF